MRPGAAGQSRWRQGGLECESALSDRAFHVRSRFLDVAPPKSTGYNSGCIILLHGKAMCGTARGLEDLPDAIGRRVLPATVRTDILYPVRYHPLQRRFHV